MPVASYSFAAEATRFSGLFTEDATKATKVAVLSKEDFPGWLEVQPALVRRWFKVNKLDTFSAGRVLVVPSFNEHVASDRVGEAACCLDGEAASPFSLCALYDALPDGHYVLHGPKGQDYEHADAAALSWALGAYRYTRYKSKPDAADSGGKRLVWAAGCDKASVTAAAASTYLVRDLISTPCEDMGPHHLEAVVADLAKEFSGTLKVVKGDELLQQNYPMIHAVGRAAEPGREPRLLDFTWGDESKPKVTLVGKGVCFDTGGLDIKPASGMLLMKKDMGGSAQVLGVARMLMARGAPVRLRVLIGAVENNIAGNAYRPGDVLVARNGKTTEIGNTDAEGRLVLGDCLSEASLEHPDLIIDCATLTGAARVALGTDVPAMFCNNDEVAAQLMTLSAAAHDHVWRMPLWEGYRKLLASKIADMNNISSGGYGGAITAALYLDEFVGVPAEEGGDAPSAKPTWIHIDFMGFNRSSSPGRPEGGEAMGMRALHALLRERYGA
eukprot:TRINITY_DN6571_c0_g1_i2.p1 TRINITY_DN6571_c0_g1~~TRINITY_DN6571_c0_g1_i2.p1  ORF type:complete len:524 (-),score=180.26 TRINITY_DN6571_c0_g1_i2:1112-2608(-)